jgi:acyl-CoA thioester hydrolase
VATLPNKLAQMNTADSHYRYFETLIPVRFADTDANGHVFFANYLTYFDIAFLECLKAIDYDFNKFTDQGLNFFYAEALSTYKAPAGFGDTLNVQVHISRFGSTSFTIAFTVKDNASNTLINSGHIVAVVVDLDSGRPVRIPPDFIAAVKRYESRHDHAPQPKP